MLALWHAEHGETARIIGAAVIAGAHFRSDARLDDDLLVEAAAQASAEDFGQEVQRLGLAGLGHAIAGGDPAPGETGDRDAGVAEGHGAGGVILRLGGADTRRQVRAARHLAIGGLGEFTNGFRLDIA
ncbi:hypothetical protein D3C86_1761910 [compost metagenome]